MSGAMSGSSGDSRGGGGGGGDGPFDCSSLVVLTTLNSPVAAVVKRLKVGDKLQVEIERGATGRDLLIAKTREGEKAGSITPPQLVTIINCMNRGHAYVVAVLSVVGGEIKIRLESGKL